MSFEMRPPSYVHLGDGTDKVLFSWTEFWRINNYPHCQWEVGDNKTHLYLHKSFLYRSELRENLLYSLGQFQISIKCLFFKSATLCITNKNSPFFAWKAENSPANLWESKFFFHRSIPRGALTTPKGAYCRRWHKWHAQKTGWGCWEVEEEMEAFNITSWSCQGPLTLCSFQVINLQHIKPWCEEGSYASDVWE